MELPYVQNYISFSPVKLFYVNLIIRSAKKPRKVKINFYVSSDASLNIISFKKITLSSQLFDV